MKIGIDFHGVIDAKPQMFSIFTQRLIDAGHEVHVITGHELTPEFIDRLNSYHIFWTYIFSIATHHKEIGTTMHYDEKNTPWMDKDVWNKTKSIYCKKNSIDLHIDDSKTYGLHFETLYMRVL